MKSVSRTASRSDGKAASGITGFDEITGGGFPGGRTSLLVGGPGSGKTIFAMQFLVHGARSCKEPGVFVAFEETAERITANIQSFGWGLDTLRPKQLTILEAQPAPDLVQSGQFDLGGMLAALNAQVRTMGARRIVFDALDIVLALLPDAAAQRREVYRLHEWLVGHRMTGLITAKASSERDYATGLQAFGFMQFMVDCAVMLNHTVVLGVSQRNVRVQKYRGSAFDENEAPFVIGRAGIDVASARLLERQDAEITNERVSSGVARMDTMLAGGYYRGAAILVTGFPGTAKTTLGGAFAEASCKRAERTLFVSFDSDGTEVTRNLSSVGIALDRFLKSGLLRMVSARTFTGSAEAHLVHIKALTKEHKARCLVIDPVSTLFKAGNAMAAHGIAERLIDWSKAAGITLLCTSLLDELSRKVDSGSTLHISTLVDTWIHLSYLDQAGERNRGMSIIKSRGTAHSNQVRELILSNDGVTLADIYTAGGEVLMGTMRWEKESAERVASDLSEVAAKFKQVQLDAEEAELEVRLKSLQTELLAKQAEKTLLSRTTRTRAQEETRGHVRMHELRGGDTARADSRK